jgi:hypothetical protein
MKNKLMTEVRYKDLTREIEKNSELLKKKLKKHKTDFKKTPSNWGFIGDLSYVNEKLVEVNTFLRD